MDKAPQPALQFDALSNALKRSSGMPQQVAAVLRDLITAGGIQPGDRIVETRIARRLNIGQPTVREALKTLEEEGLVVRHANRGCSVTILSLDEINQIFRLRVEWEVLAVRLAMENWSEAKAGRLRAASERLRNSADLGQIERFYHDDLEFHRELWRLSGNVFLEKALNNIVVPLFTFVIMKRLREGSFNLKATAMEHEAVVKAVATGDAHHAGEACRSALEGFWKVIREKEREGSDT